MLKRTITLLMMLALGAFLPGLALSHTPLCSCYDGGDGSVVCEGGFSDGSSAAGVEIRVKDKDGNVLIKGKMDEFSEFTFDKPSGSYTVEFDAGPGHVVGIEGKDIAE